MKSKISLILELQMHLLNEKIQKPNFLKEWLIDIKTKITILKDCLSAYSSVKMTVFLPVEEKEPI